MSNWLEQIGPTAGAVLLAAVLSLITGKTLKYIIYLILSKLSKKTDIVEDDKIVGKIAEDWHIEKEVSDVTEEKR